MSNTTCLAALLVALLPSTAWSQPAQDRMWSWKDTCDDGMSLELQVRIFRKTEFRRTVRFCEEAPGSPRSDSRWEVVLTSTHGFRWSGYRDHSETSPPGEPLTINIWEAGRDERGVILGFTAMSERNIFMNTILFACPDKPARWEVGKGLVIASVPIGAPSASNRPNNSSRCPY